MISFYREAGDRAQQVRLAPVAGQMLDRLVDEEVRLLAGAILQASTNIQLIFSTLSGVADQALFLTDLLAFFEMQPTIRSKPNALPAPRPIRRGFEFRNVSFSRTARARRRSSN